MSSKIEVQRVCEHCSIRFLAKTTVTRFCTHKCSQRAYKERKRLEKIDSSNNETKVVVQQPMQELGGKPYLSVVDTSRLLGVSRRTVYRMIDRKELVVAKVGTRTIIRRSDIDKLFGKPLQIRVRKEPQPVTEFYTVKDIENIYTIKYGRLNTIIKNNNIPNTIYNGKLRVSKAHIDRYFKKERGNTDNIIEWYSVNEIREKYQLSRDQVYVRISRNNIPKVRIGKYVKISKLHFDELFHFGV